MPLLRTRFEGYDASQLAQRFESRGLPYAPITKPHALFDDPHLLATGGLAPVRIPADASGTGRAVDTLAALLPLTLDGQRLPLRSGPPRLGEHSLALLRGLGYDEACVAQLLQEGVVGGPASG